MDIKISEQQANLLVDILEEKLAVNGLDKTTKAIINQILDNIDEARGNVCGTCMGTGKVTENAGKCGGCDICGSDDEMEVECPDCKNK